MARQLHQLAERRSRAIHGVVAERLASDPSVLERARGVVGVWLQDGTVAHPYAEAWQCWLALPSDQLRERLSEDSEEARAMRQVSPFAGVISPRERWAIWKLERSRFETDSEERETG
jgi:hypothetical protein